MTTKLENERAQRIIANVRPGRWLRSQPEPAQALADRMRYHMTPGASVAVIDNGKIDWAAGFGVRDLRTSELVTTETLFQAASISKPVTALAVLRLVDAGEIDLDTDVNRYLKSWRVPKNGDWQPKITLRQLLSHSAGTTVHGFPGYPIAAPIPTLAQILDGVPPANTGPVRVNILPGAQFRYSGGGTTIVQQLLIDHLGKPFPAIMRELVLDPLGMNHSTYEMPLPENKAQLAASAHSSPTAPVEGRWHLYPELAAAALWTTPTDLARFAIAIQLSLAGKPNTILTKAMVEQMVSPTADDHMGIGFFLEGKDDAARFGHGGSNHGFICEMKAYQRRGQGAVVMTNSNHGYGVVSELTQAIAEEYGWPGYAPQEPKVIDLGPEILAGYIGRYELKPGRDLLIAHGPEGLQLESPGQEPIPLYAESQTKFFARALDLEIVFENGGKGEVEKLVLHQGWAQHNAKKV
jgi:CubicO group peptidase (beta-lactamase class C family)